MNFDAEMDFEEELNLEGSEFITTFFPNNDEPYMILALGHNMDGEKKGPTFVFLYLCIEGSIEHGINSFVFMQHEQAWEFIEQLPTMSAIDFMIKGTSLPPTIL